MISNSMSKVDVLKEKAELDKFMGWFNYQFRKYGTWASRLSRQQEAKSQYKSKDIENRIKTIDSILSNPSNISRWNEEEKAEKQRIEDIRIAEDQRLQQIKNQEITFNEQKNSGDFNETPITDVNLSSGCSECTEPKHQMPDGSMMKDSDMEKGNNMKFAGIAAAGVIALLLYTKGGLK